MGLKKCPKCGKFRLVSETSKFCNTCATNLAEDGTSRTPVCLRTGSCKPPNPSWTYCETCGGRLDGKVDDPVVETMKNIPAEVTKPKAKEKSVLKAKPRTAEEIAARLLGSSSSDDSEDTTDEESVKTKPTVVPLSSFIAPNHKSDVQTGELLQPAHAATDIPMQSPSVANANKASFVVAENAPIAFLRVRGKKISSSDSDDSVSGDFKKARMESAFPAQIAEQTEPAAAAMPQPAQVSGINSGAELEEVREKSSASDAAMETEIGFELFIADDAKKHADLKSQDEQEDWCDAQDAFVVQPPTKVSSQPTQRASTNDEVPLPSLKVSSGMGITSGFQNLQLTTPKTTELAPSGSTAAAYTFPDVLDPLVELPGHGPQPAPLNAQQQTDSAANSSAGKKQVDTNAVDTGHGSQNFQSESASSKSGKPLTGPHIDISPLEVNVKISDNAGNTSAVPNKQPNQDGAAEIKPGATKNTLNRPRPGEMNQLRSENVDDELMDDEQERYQAQAPSDQRGDEHQELWDDEQEQGHVEAKRSRTDHPNRFNPGGDAEANFRLPLPVPDKLKNRRAYQNNYSMKASPAARDFPDELDDEDDGQDEEMFGGGMMRPMFPGRFMGGGFEDFMDDDRRFTRMRRGGPGMYGMPFGMPFGPSSIRLKVTLRVYVSKLFKMTAADKFTVEYQLISSRSNTSQKINSKPLTSSSSDDQTDRVGNFGLMTAQLELPKKRFNQLFPNGEPQKLLAYRYVMTGRKTTPEAAIESSSGNRSQNNSDQLWRRLEVSQRDVSLSTEVTRCDGVAIPYDKNRKGRDALKTQPVQDELEQAFGQCLPNLDNTTSYSFHNMNSNAKEFSDILIQFANHYDAADMGKKFLPALVQHIKSRLDKLVHPVRADARMAFGFVMLLTFENLQRSGGRINPSSLYAELNRQKQLGKLCALLINFQPNLSNPPKNANDYTVEFQDWINHRFEDRYQQMNNGLAQARNHVLTAMQTLTRLNDSGKVYAFLLLPLYHALDENFRAYDIPNLEMEAKSETWDSKWWGTAQWGQSDISELRSAFASVNIETLKEMYYQLSETALQVDPISCRSFVYLLSLEQLVEFADWRYDRLTVEACVAALINHFTKRSSESNFKLSLLHKALTKLCIRAQHSVLQSQLEKLTEIKDLPIYVWLKTIDHAMQYSRQLFQLVQDRFFLHTMSKESQWRKNANEDDQFEMYQAISKFLTTIALNAPPVINNRYTLYDRDMESTTLQRRITMQNVMKTGSTVLRLAQENVSNTLMSMLPHSLALINSEDEHGRSQFDRRPLALLAHSLEIAKTDPDRSWEGKLADALIDAIGSLNYQQRIALYFRLDRFFALENNQPSASKKSSDLVLPERILEEIHQSARVALELAFEEVKVREFTDFPRYVQLLSEHVLDTVKDTHALELINDTLTTKNVARVLEQFLTNRRLLELLDSKAKERYKKLEQAMNTIRYEPLVGGTIKLAAVELIEQSEPEYLRLLQLLEKNPDVNKMQAMYRMRVDEMNRYKKVKRMVTVFSNFFQPYKNTILEDWRNKNREDDKQMSLLDLVICRRSSIVSINTDSRYKMPASDYIDKVLQPLAELAESKWLAYLLKDYGTVRLVQQASEAQVYSMDLQSIRTDVFDATMSYLQKIYLQVKDGSIKAVDTAVLIDVACSGQSAAIAEQQLRAEFVLLSRFHDGDKDGSNWIEPRLAQTVIVRDIGRSRKIAEKLNKVRKLFQLKGDFSIVDRILDKKATNKLPLVKFDQSWKKEYSLLSECGDEECDALAMFATDDVKRFVDWLRKEVASMRDFRTLIQLASAVGENDQEVSRVHTLDSAVNGYESLIYNLPTEDGFEGLFKSCNDLFAHLKKEPKLAKQLQDASREMTWLESLKNIRTSVELTSVKELELIHDYGRFSVHFNQDAMIGRTLTTPLGVNLRIDKKLAERAVNRKYKTNTGAEPMQVDNEAQLYTSTISGTTAEKDCAIELQRIQAAKADYTHDDIVDLTSRLMLISNYQPIRSGPESDETRQTERKAQAAQQKRIQDFLTLFNRIDSFTDTYLELLRNEIVLFNALKCEVRCFVTTDYENMQMLEADRELLKLEFQDPVNKVVRVDAPPAQFQSEIAAMTLQTIAPTLNERMDMQAWASEYVRVVHMFFEYVLSDWRTHLTTMQEQYYELNHFTAKQLMILRRELGVFRQKNSKRKIDDRVYPILCSAYRMHVNEELLNESVKLGLANNWMKMQQVDQTKKIDEAYLERIKQLPCVIRDFDAVYGAWKESKMQTGETLKSASYLALSLYDLWCEHSRIYEQQQCDEQQTGYLSLPELGAVLRQLTNLAVNEASIKRKGIIRHIPVVIKKRMHNLIVCDAHNQLVVVLSLYKYRDDATDSKLPTREEVLVCSEQTTVEEIDLFWKRVTIPKPEVLAKQDKLLYTLVGVHRLPYEIQEQAEKLMDLRNRKNVDDFSLAIVCAREHEDSCRMAITYGAYRADPTAVARLTCEPEEICKFLESGLRLDCYFGPELIQAIGVPAPKVDKSQSTVRFVRSERAGVGKTLFIRRREADLRRRLASNTLHDKGKYTEGSYRTVADIKASCNSRNNRKELDLQELKKAQPRVVTLSLYKRTVELNEVLDSLPICSFLVPDDLKSNDCGRNVSPRIYHIDVGHYVQENVDDLLFQLLILGSLTNSDGFVWLKQPYDMYYVENMPIYTTVRDSTNDGYKQVRKPIHRILEFLPQHVCLSPKNVLSRLRPRESFQLSDEEAELIVDEKGSYWFPYLHLSEHVKSNSNYYKIEYKERLEDRQIAKTGKEYCNFIGVLMKTCGVSDPSWAELHNFCSFLNEQLLHCIKSDFYKMDTGRKDDTLPSFREFVVSFMVHMSRDFATRSLKIAEETPDANGEQSAGEEIDLMSLYQIKRTWEASPHPYLFFNYDKQSLTFLGFKLRLRNKHDPFELVSAVDPHDPKRILMPNIMGSRLYNALVNNRVRFDRNYDEMTKHEKIEVIARVMGISATMRKDDKSDKDVPFFFDPDITYELTTDNMKKLLAIYMRLECNIPVIIMGETGCGKTRMVNYLCQLQISHLRYEQDRRIKRMRLRDANYTERAINNIVTVKIHGGILERELLTIVERAEELADKNAEYTLNLINVANQNLDLVLEIQQFANLPLEARKRKENENNFRLKQYKNNAEKLKDFASRHAQALSALAAESSALALRLVDSIPKGDAKAVTDLIAQSLIAAQQLSRQAKQLKVPYTVLFLDETNSSEIVHLIKELLCDRRLKSKVLSPNLKIVCACNPYRKHRPEIIEKLKQAGLGYFKNESETRDLFGRVPMRHLVYRVQPLPKSLLPFVWDFGQLNSDVEKLYITQIVARHVRNMFIFEVNGEFPLRFGVFGDANVKHTDTKYSDLVKALVHALHGCQEFMRKQADECSFVSLRDVERTLTVFRWIVLTHWRTTRDSTKITLFGAINARLEHFHLKTLLDDPLRAIILAISVCYHCSLQEKRADFRKFLAREALTQMPLKMPRPELHVTVATAANKEDAAAAAGTGTGTQQQSPVQIQPLSDKEVEDMANRILMEIEACQDVFVVNCENELGPNIARNRALKENIFMMVACIDLRIPLFLVGKPGSSKSLAKSIVQNAMQGDKSKTPLFRAFKRAAFTTFQCSPHTTPAGIIGTLRQCVAFQKHEVMSTESYKIDQNAMHFEMLDKYVHVAVLDEIGLAEDSPLMPLKTLHSLLEDGCPEDDEAAQEDRFEVLIGEKFYPYRKIGFIGISNWALDPAKTNRGILVQRTRVDRDELIETARGICNHSSQFLILRDDVARDDAARHNTFVKQTLEPFIEPLSDAYLEVYQLCNEHAHKEFFGLRDFYACIKMLIHFVIRERDSAKVDAVAQVASGTGKLRWIHFKHAIMRNFSGLDSPNVQPLSIFEQKLDVFFHEEIEASRGMAVRARIEGAAAAGAMGNQNQMHAEEDQDDTLLDTSPVNLIKQNLLAGMLTASSELPLMDKSHVASTRYLLVITEDYGSYSLLRQLVLASDTALIFGSKFPKDQQYTQICKDINRIKLTMDVGQSCILLNMDALYESLYDVLNQYYSYWGGVKFVDLGLGTHRVKCKVHDNFKMVVVATKEVAYKFPIPLLSRLEKHLFSAHTLLNAEHRDAVARLEAWCNTFRKTNEKIAGSSVTFTLQDLFVGFSNETLASIVLHTWLKGGARGRVDEKNFKERVERCIELLIDCATTDAILRLDIRSNLDIFNNVQKLQHVYWMLQGHRDLADYLKKLLFPPKLDVRDIFSVAHNERTKDDMFLQVTTYSRLLSLAERDLNDLKSALVEGVPDQEVRIEIHFLQAFDTILDFENVVKTFMENARKGSTDLRHVLIVQVNRGYLNQELLLCAQLKIQDVYHHLNLSSMAGDGVANKQEQRRQKNPFVVACVVQIPRKVGGCFNGYQCGFWRCVHIDDLIREGDANMLVDLQRIRGKSIADLFCGEDVLMSDAAGSVVSGEDTSYIAIDRLIIASISGAVAMLKFAEYRREHDRANQLIKRLKTLLTEGEEQSTTTMIIRKYMLRGIRQKIGHLFYERDKRIGTEQHDERDAWLRIEAASADAIFNNSTLSQSVVALLKQKTAPMLATVLAYLDTNHNLDSLADLAAAQEREAAKKRENAEKSIEQLRQMFIQKIWQRILTWKELFDLTFEDALQHVRCGTGLSVNRRANDVCYASEVDVQYFGFYARSTSVLSASSKREINGKRVPFAFIMLRDIEKIMTTAREQLKRDTNRSEPLRAEEQKNDQDPRGLLSLLAETAYLHRNSAICKMFTDAIDSGDMTSSETRQIRKKVGEDYLMEFICSMHLVQHEDELKLLENVFKTAAAILIEKTCKWLKSKTAQNPEQAQTTRERLEALALRQADKLDDLDDLMLLPAYHVALRGLYATRFEYLRELVQHMKTVEQFCQRMRDFRGIRDSDVVHLKFEFVRSTGSNVFEYILCDLHVLTNVTTQLIGGTTKIVNSFAQLRNNNEIEQLANGWFEGCIEPLFTIAQSMLDTLEGDWPAIYSYFDLNQDDQKKFSTKKDFCRNALRNMRVLGLFRNEVWSKCARCSSETGRGYLRTVTSLSAFWTKFSTKEMLNCNSLFEPIEEYLKDIFKHKETTQIFGKCEKCKNNYGPSGVCVTVVCNHNHGFLVCSSCLNANNNVDCPKHECQGLATFDYAQLVSTASAKESYEQNFNIYRTLVQATGHFLVRFIALNLPASYSAIDKAVHRNALGDSSALVDKLLSYAVVAPLSLRSTGANTLAVLTKPIMQYDLASGRNMQHAELSMLQTFILRRLTELARLDKNVEKRYDAVLSNFVNDYIANAQTKNAQQLCNTCIACYEDLEYLDMAKATESHNFARRVDEMRQRLYKWMDNATSIDSRKVLSVLQAIAGARFLVQELVEIVHTFVDLVLNKFTEQLTEEAFEYLVDYLPRLPNDLNAFFFTEMQFGERKYKIDTFYRYFVRLYVRKYGLNSFRTLFSVQNFEFISASLTTIMPSLAASGGRVLLRLVDLDFFMLYGENYFKIRSQWQPWFVESKNAFTTDKPFDASDDRALFSSLAIVRLATRMDRDLPSMDEFSKLLLNFVNASTAQFVARLAISVLSLVKIVKGELPHWRYLVDLLTHWAVCLYWARTTASVDNTNLDSLIGPVYQLVVSPQLCGDSYLPGMPSDDLFVVRKKLLEQRKLDNQVADNAVKAASSQDDAIYICPSGHANVASGVDTAVLSKLCRECGLPIGGANYNLYEGSRQIRLDQQESMLPGHILGSPEKRPLEPIPQRQLSPVSVCVLRMITHLSLLASSFNLPLANLQQEGDRDPAAAIIMHLIRLPPQSNVRLNNYDDLWKFLLHHVNVDLQVLMRALHCDNVDEVCLFLHRVLKQVPELVRTNKSDRLEQVGLWKEREARDKWENNFINQAVVPQLRECQSPSVVTAEGSNEVERQQFSFLHYIYNDQLLPAENAAQTGSSDPLFVQLLQADSVWQLRQRVSIINVERKLADERNRLGSGTAGDALFELTGMFLSNHRVYAQLQKLPDLIELYREWLPIVNRRLSLADAKRTRMDKYMEELSEQQRNVIAPKLDVYIAAWNTLRDRLLQYSFNGYRLQDLGSGVQLTPSSTVDHFLPSFHGRGLCAMLLITHLIEQHNILIEKASKIAQTRRERANLKQKDASTSWKITLRDLNRAHTVVFNGELDLLDFLSLNATYGTNEAHVNSLQYDFANIEAYIEDTWLSNKPLIDYSSAKSYAYADDDQSILPTVVYSEDVTMSLNFAKLRNKIKQSTLPTAILETLYSREIELPHLNEMIRDLETAITLLASSGADAGENLAHVMKTQLGLQRPLAQNDLVANLCCVNHVEQLWYLLSYRRTIELKRSRHDPFAHIDEHFKSELTDQMRIELNNLVFGFIHVSFLMEAVYLAVIIRQPFQQASSIQSNYLDQPLSAVLRNHLRFLADDESGDVSEAEINAKIDKQYGLHRLPSTIRVRHSVDLFNTAFKYNERQPDSV